MVSEIQMNNMCTKRRPTVDGYNTSKYESGKYENCAKRTTTTEESRTCHMELMSQICGGMARSGTVSVYMCNQCAVEE